MENLEKKIGLFGLTMIAVGSCIGAGIFATPGTVAGQLPNPWMILLVWTCGGLVALTGAITFAELGGMFPKAGGVYVFIKETYGAIWGFLYGWIILFAVNTGALAALTIAFTDYLEYLIPMDAGVKLILSVGIIMLLSALNTIGVSVSEWLSSVFTVLKLIAIAAIICFAVYYGMQDNGSASSYSGGSGTSIGFGAFFLALIGVLWSFGGWHHASYMAAETRSPSVNVPKAMIIGALIVTITYVGINAAYLTFLNPQEMASSGRVAADALQKFFPFGAKMVSVMVMISIFGTIAIYSMSAPRVYFAMANDGIFLRFFGHIHKRFKTPANAILAQGLWAVVIILWFKSFKNIITYAVFMDILFMLLAAVAVLILRKKRPEWERPYKIRNYPLIPLIFILITSIFIINTLIFSPVEALAGLVITAGGIPFYLFFKKIKIKDHA